jgi:RNA polymerase sigma factor (sigma-70 family)
LNVPDPNSTFIGDEAWARFVSLMTPATNYHEFFKWLVYRVRKMSRFDRQFWGWEEDVAGETILRVWSAFQNGSKLDQTSFRRFVLRVSKNYIIDQQRRPNDFCRHFNFTLQDIELHSDDMMIAVTFPSFHAHEMNIEASKLLQNLSPDERQILDLMQLGSSGREIAEKLKVTEQSARKKISRLKMKLRTKRAKTMSRIDLCEADDIERAVSVKPKAPADSFNSAHCSSSFLQRRQENLDSLKLESTIEQSRAYRIG